MTGALAPHFAALADTTRRRAPFYSRLSAGIADSPLVEELYADAPGPARVPVMLLAAVHYLLLAEPDADLARFYPNLGAGAAGDPVPVFLEYCSAHAAEIRRLLATRLPQTNEVGRSALLVAGLGRLEPGPVALLDIGASAGLNLLLDRFAYGDGAGHRLGESPVVIDCLVTGRRPEASGRHGLADRLPQVEARLGLDANPVDLADPDACRWLEACVWPDQADRFERLRRAIELNAGDPVQVRRGDAVDDLEAVLGEFGEGHRVVTTSWVLSYLPAERQHEFVATLDRLGRSRWLSWVWAEAPNLNAALPVPDGLRDEPRTTLGVTTWRDGERTDTVLAQCHQHGYWLSWY
jgi:hypothetical protein